MQTSITPIEAELNGLYQVLDRHLTNNICPPVRNCLPALLGDNDCVITALTGSGKKTVLATALLYLTSPHFASNGGAIILTPTHSIAKQVRERFISVRRLMAGVVGAELANIIPLYDFSLTLESPAAQQQCFQPNSICIGTPGCMLDALRLRRRQLPMEEEARGGYWRQSVMTEHLSGRRVLVALVNAELLTHTELECSVRDLLDTLGRAGNRYRLILMASSIPKFTVAEFIEREMRQPQFIIVKPEDCLGRVDYSYLLFPVVSGTADSSGELLQRKVAALIWLYRRHIQLNGSDQRLCVFCNSTQTARKLASSLHDSGIFASLMVCCTNL
jgi:superfamily II DNA/RNA helicase